MAHVARHHRAAIPARQVHYRHTASLRNEFREVTYKGLNLLGEFRIFSQHVFNAPTPDREEHSPQVLALSIRGLSQNRIYLAELLDCCRLTAFPAMTKKPSKPIPGHLPHFRASRIHQARSARFSQLDQLSRHGHALSRRDAMRP